MICILYKSIGTPSRIMGWWYIIKGMYNDLVKNHFLNVLSIFPSIRVYWRCWAGLSQQWADRQGGVLRNQCAARTQLSVRVSQRSRVVSLVCFSLDWVTAIISVQPGQDWLVMLSVPPGNVVLVCEHHPESQIHWQAIISLAPYIINWVI